MGCCEHRKNADTGARGEGVKTMQFILWAIFGGIAGWLASIFMKTNASQGMLMDVILGVVGGLVGGLIMNLFGFSGVTGFNLYSMFVSVLGAVVLIALGRALTQSAV